MNDPKTKSDTSLPAGEKQILLQSEHVITWQAKKVASINGIVLIVLACLVATKHIPIAATILSLLSALIFTIAYYILSHNEQQRSATLMDTDIPIQSVTGLFSKKYEGAYGNGNDMYIASIDNFRLPAIILTEDLKSMEQLLDLDQPVTVEYLPTISKNRCCYDGQGHSYNFITKSTDNIKS